MADTPNQQTPGLLANILAVAGFIILIVIIVWGAYHLLRLTGSGVSSLFSRFSSNDTIAITIPTTPVPSGKSFPLTWKYAPKENGSYALLYQCKSGFRLDATAPTGAVSTIPCGNAFTIGSTTSIVLTPMLSGSPSLDVPISVIYMPTATSSAARPQGSATLRVAAGTATATSTGTGINLPPIGKDTGTGELQEIQQHAGDDDGQHAPPVAGAVTTVKCFSTASISQAGAGLFVDKFPNPKSIGICRPRGPQPLRRPRSA